MCGHVHLRCRGVEEVCICTISPCNCCEILLSCSIYYYVKLKSAWFPAVSACAEGLVSIVTNIKELAGTSVWSCIWACFAVPCNPVRVLDGWQTSSQVCGCHYYTLVALCTSACTLRAKNRHSAKWSWRWGGKMSFSLITLPSVGRAAKWKHWRIHQRVFVWSHFSPPQSERCAWELGPLSPKGNSHWYCHYCVLKQSWCLVCWSW